MIFRDILISFENNLLDFNKRIFFEEKNYQNKNSMISVNNEIEVSNYCDSVDCYFSKIKKPINPSCFNIQQPSFEFSLEFFKNISNFHYNYKRNLSYDEMLFLFKFIKEKPFKVVELDKGVGIGVINNNLYDSLCLDILSNSDNYVKIDLDPLNDSCNYINETLHNLYKNKNISLKLYNKLKVNKLKCKVGSFRILPKVHKEKFSVRPIVNCRDHFTSDLCLLVDLILRPFVEKCSSYLKDSTHLLQEAEDLEIPDDCELVSGDFDSLYSNIMLEDALNLICDFIKEEHRSDHIDIKAFREILKIIFEFNIFKYKNIFYRQIKGIAMGSKSGPSIANIFVFIYEVVFLRIHRPIFYKRFIDDIFMIIKKGFNFEYLTKSFGELKLNILNGPTVNFLDLNISICILSKKLKFKLFIKPTNTFCYLPTHSNHPSFIFKNIPKSIFMRVRRICSSYSDFLFYCRLFIFQLLNRGYDFILLFKTMFMVSKMKRDSLICYKEKKKFEIENNITFKFPYDFNFLNSKKIIYESFNNIKNRYDFLKDKKLRIINYIQPNINRLLVHNYPINLNNFKLFKFYKCSHNEYCDVCPFSSDHYYIRFNNNFYLPLCINSNCSSKGIIYILKCNLCSNVYYIGESGRSVKKRISEHIKDIQKFRAYYIYKNVSYHFNLIGHNYLQHLSFYIFKIDCNDLHTRRYYESMLIYIFLKNNNNLLNDEKDCDFKYKKFSNLKFKNTFNFCDA